MGSMERAKGATFERWVVRELREAYGLDKEEVKRGLGQSRGGGKEVPDVVVGCLPMLHFELKHHAKVVVRAALTQAERDSGGAKIPVAVCKNNRETPIVAMYLDDLVALYALARRGAAPASTPNRGAKAPIARVDFADFVDLVRPLVVRRSA